MDLCKAWGLSCALLLAGAALSAGELPDSVRFNPNGTFKVGDAEFFIQHYDGAWKPSTSALWIDRKSTLTKQGLDLTAAIKISGTVAKATETITPISADTFRLDATVSCDPPVKFNALHGALYLPSGLARSFFVDGKEVKIPKEQSKNPGFFNKAAVKEVVVPLAGGYRLTVAGAFRLAAQDSRQWQQDIIALRFGFDPNQGDIAKAALSLTFKVEAVKVDPLDLAAAANRGFADDKGGMGWTGQGPNNDLSAMKPGTIRFDALSFRIIDPAANNGKAALVLGGSNRDAFPRSLKVVPPAPVRAGAVNLLHATAWTPKNDTVAGTVVVNYASGKSETVAVKSGVDVGNWWNPQNLANAQTAWSKENPESAIGLYASSFALKDEPVASFEFRAEDPDVLWMIPAATLSSEPVRFVMLRDKEVVLAPGRDWVELDFKSRVVPGSPLDFSFIADAPAGKYGRAVARPDGTLGFENAPGKRLKLFGANLCFSASFVDREVADLVADDFVKTGYNTVRIHHHDTELLDPKAPDTLTFDPAKLERLDYLFAAMKKRGLYVTTDLYTNRIFKPGDRIPECDFYDHRQMKELLPFSKAAMESWKEYARRWMNHVNPHTGLAWKDDPALVFVNLVNEETLTRHWSLTPSVAKRYREMFEPWKTANKFPNAKADNDDPAFRRFLNELQGKVLDEQLAFVRGELGLKAMATSLNYVNEKDVTLLRPKFDLVDNHAYFDHPGFLEERWKLPYTFKQQSAVERLAIVPRNMMATRVFGKPFVVTEYNYCNPNVHRAEGGPLIGAYAALQDWDGLYRFAWSHSNRSLATRGPVSGGFDGVNDPMAQLADRITAALFVRGDAAASKKKFAYELSPAVFAGPRSYPNGFTLLGLVAQIGSAEKGAVPAGVTAFAGDEAADAPGAGVDPADAARWRKVLDDKIADADTGQIHLDAKRYGLAVRSPRTETLTLKSGALAGDVLSVSDADTFQTVAVISLDGEPLAISKNMLLVHLTNVGNTGAKFGNEAKTVLREAGKLPLLVQRGKAKVALKGAPVKVTALSPAGEPRGEVKGAAADGVYRFTVDTTAFPGGVMAYHLTR